jgi:Ca-activated chloride channel family protein
LAGDTGRPSYVIFMTDGLPTAGEQNPANIARNAKEANRAKARLFAFGVGFDVNARLLDQLTTDNAGASEYVRPNENIESAMAKFYGRMTAPVMTHLKLELARGDVNRMYPRDIPDLFAGGQIVSVGRYRESGETKIRLSGRVGDREQTFEFPATLARGSWDETNGFIEKLWATRRVGEVINELDLRGRNQELIDELVRLSTKHGILTPYTAFLADERTNLFSSKDNADRAEQAAFAGADSLSNVTGPSGVNLRAAKGGMQRAEAAPQQGRQRYMDAKGLMKEEDNVQIVGNKAMFRRSNRWVDPTVTPDEEKKAEVVEQFSDRYFELARNNTSLRKYLALPEGCTVKIEGRVYQINAAQQPTRG